MFYFGVRVGRGGFLGLAVSCGVGVIYLSWLDLICLMVWVDLLG